MTTQLTFDRKRTFTRADFDPYIGRNDGKMYQTLQALPHATDVDHEEFLNHIASGGHMMQPLWGYARPSWDRQPQWTMFFLLSDGTGYAVTYGHPPSVKHFALCKHEVEVHPDARPNYGWHPGHCRLCGFDMTYDSGD